MNEANKIAAQRQDCKLSAKVAARNNANRIAWELAPKLFEVLAPFVGQKVILATGGKSAKLKAALAAFCQSTVPVSIWIDQGHGYSLVLRVKTCESGPRSCAYMEASIYLGELNCGVLTKLFEMPEARHYRTDYTPEEVRALREDWKAKRDAASAARSLWEVPEFGEHDAF